MIAILRHPRNRGTLTLLALFVAVTAVAVLVWWLGQSPPTGAIEVETPETDIVKESNIDTEVETLRYVTNDLQDGLKHLNMRVHDLSTTIDKLEQRFEEDLISLNRQVYRLTNSIARVDEFEEEILHVRTAVDSLTASAAVKTSDPKAVVEEATSQSSDAVTRMHEAMEIRESTSANAAAQQKDVKNTQETASASVEITSEAAVSANPPQSTNRTSKDTLLRTPRQRPWVINLASIQDKEAADRFAARARSRGITVEQNSMTFKGKEFWRIQITGFLTANDARTYAASAKEKLGLKETWVMKR